MLRRSWRVWKEVDPALSIGGYISGAAALFGLPMAAVTAWAFSQLTWFWNTFQLAGVLIIGLITWLLVGLGLNLYRPAKDGQGERRVPDPLLIGAGLAALIFLGCLIAYGMRAQANTPAPSSPTTAADSKKPDADSHLANIRLEWSGTPGPIDMYVKFARSGERMAIYVQYGTIGTGIEHTSTVFSPPSPGSRGPRQEIAFVDRFARDQEFRLSLGTVTVVGGGQLVLQWGAERYNNQGVGISSGSYSGFITLVASDGREESHPFMIVGRVVINPSVITELLRGG